MNDWLGSFFDGLCKYLCFNEFEVIPVILLQHKNPENVISINCMFELKLAA